MANKRTFCYDVLMLVNKKIQLGIIGLGNMGLTYANILRDGKVPEFHLAAVADRHDKRLEKFPEARKFSDGSDLIKSRCVDAVLIVTPHFEHTSLGCEALDAGLHVLVDKPISVHKADCQRLIERYRNPVQIFAAMFNQRTNPFYLKLRELIQSNEMGEIQRINWIVTDWYRPEIYYRTAKWRATWRGEGGGVLLNQCPHNLDLLQWLFGMPKKITALCQFGRFHNIEVDDAVTALLEYENGATGVFVTTTGEAPGTNRLEVAADRGRVVLENEKFSYTRTEEFVSEHCRNSQDPFGKPEVWHVELPVEGKGEQHLGILKNFAGAILGREALIAPAIEGIHSVELANAILYSSFSGETVHLPIDAEAYEAELQKRISNSTFRKAPLAESVSVDMSQSF
jgi:predicted dehydrogenase